MCGRYYIDDGTSAEIRKILNQLENRYENEEIKTGEIFPTNRVPILTSMNDRIEPELFTWGMPNFKNKGVIINARAETVSEKPLFRESLYLRRCIIPANGFYEWDSSKNKIFFKMYNSDIIYMAGIYNTFQGVNRFVILTTNANKSMEDVHHRMPLILTEEEKENWLFDKDKISNILITNPPLLDREAEYVQNRFNFD